MIQALALTPDFEWAVFAEGTDEGDTDEFGMPKYWSLKKKRNGYKGRTFKHPLNFKKKKKRTLHNPKPYAC